jgi:hypothetical protein
MINEVDKATLKEKDQVKRAAKLLLGNPKSVSKATLIEAIGEHVKADRTVSEKELLERVPKTTDGKYNLEEAIELYYTFAHLLPK